jgi:hypothetical protein
MALASVQSFLLILSSLQRSQMGSIQIFGKLIKQLFPPSIIEQLVKKQV